MNRIANTRELQSELRALLVYSESRNPSRAKLASALVSLASRVAPRDLTMVVAMEHATPEAREKYLHEHPKANPKNHTVKGKDTDSGSKSDALEYDLSGLPKNQTDYTQAQHKKVIDWLAKKPTKELRKRQDLVKQQIGKAFNDRNDQALSNLHVMEKHLDTAIDKREFGDSD